MTVKNESLSTCRVTVRIIILERHDAHGVNQKGKILENLLAYMTFVSYSVRSVNG